MSTRNGKPLRVAWVGGGSTPKYDAPMTELVQFRIPSDQKRWLQDRSQATGQGMSDIIRALIDDAMSREHKHHG